MTVRDLQLEECPLMDADANILLTEYGEPRLASSAWPSPPTSAGILALRSAAPRFNMAARR
jgi:hypothetical protein